MHPAVFCHLWATTEKSKEFFWTSTWTLRKSWEILLFLFVENVVTRFCVTAGAGEASVSVWWILHARVHGARPHARRSLLCPPSTLYHWQRDRHRHGIRHVVVYHRPQSSGIVSAACYYSTDPVISFSVCVSVCLCLLSIDYVRNNL